MRLTGFVCAVALVVSPMVVVALEPADKCESSKLKVAGKYGLCRLKAESKAVKTVATPDFSKCDAKFADKWAQTESSAGAGVCPSQGDSAAIQAFIAQTTENVAAALAGGALPDCEASLACGNGTIDAGEDCDQGDLGGATCFTEGFPGGALACGAGCTFDTSSCSNVRFVDNGDGTVTDVETGLMWEKKDDGGGIHDYDNIYTWSTTGMAPDGTAFTTFLVTLNAGTSPDGTAISGCFAGHCDWRLPTIAELQSILLEPFPCGANPCIDPIFGPTHAQSFWSGTTVAGNPGNAWFVYFTGGLVDGINKTFNGFARAVRGGS
jgi:hypothetical protein